MTMLAWLGLHASPPGPLTGDWLNGNKSVQQEKYAIGSNCKEVSRDKYAKLLCVFA
jgi:hypothetical protein